MHGEDPLPHRQSSRRSRHLGQPGLGPDGSGVAFAEWSGREEENADIFTLDPDGGARQLVSMTAEWNFRPNWGNRAPVATGINPGTS